MSELYNRTDIYDLFENQEKFDQIQRHWAKVLEGKPVTSLLDVSIGTGNLTLPAGNLGIKLYGSDLNEAMLEKCAVKAEQRGLGIELRPCDFRELTSHFTEQFDCVASTGNSLPYVNNEEVVSVLEQMDALTRPGGYLYYDMRNWDKILRDRNRFYLYNPAFVGDVRVNLIQVWDYLPDGPMTFNLLFTFERDNQVFQKKKFAEHYFPVRRALLLNKLQSMGYQNIQIMCHPAFLDGPAPEETDWYCVIAQKDSR